MEKLFFVFTLFTLFVISKSDVTTQKELMKKFEIRQIKKGLETEKTNKYQSLVVYFVFYDTKTKDVVYENSNILSLGTGSVPLCLDYVLLHMTMMERVVMRCPSDLAFSQENIGKFHNLVINKEYIVDMQIWNIGDPSRTIE